MSVRQLKANKRPKDGRSWAFYTSQKGLDGKWHQYQSKAYATKEEATRAEMEYKGKFKEVEINHHITFLDAYNKLYEYK